MPSVSTALKVHYNQEMGDPSGHFFFGGGECTMASGGNRRPWLPRYDILCHQVHLLTFDTWLPWKRIFRYYNATRLTSQ